jgi:hypothetical protein
VRKRYTGFPLEKPHPALKGERKIWEPMLLVRIGSSKHATSPRFLAVVDSGSPFCLFQASFGELIGIDVTKGTEDQIGGILAVPKEPIYFHKIRLYVEADWVIDVMAGFVKKLIVPGILGRNGFFDNFQVHFDHSEYPPIVDVKRIERPC